MGQDQFANPRGSARTAQTAGALCGFRAFLVRTQKALCAFRAESVRCERMVPGMSARDPLEPQRPGRWLRGSS